MSKPEPVSQVSASALNEYGLPYDPDAVPVELPARGKLNFSSFTAQKTSTNPDLATIQEMTTGAWLNYDLKNQCWVSKNTPSASAMDISQLYEKIDLSKTQLMRDKQGNPCGGWKNIAIKYPNSLDDEGVAQLEKEAALRKTTTGAKNSYGLYYDHDYRMPSQVIVFMEKGITGSVDSSKKLINFSYI